MPAKASTPSSPSFPRRRESLASAPGSQRREARQRASSTPDREAFGARLRATRRKYGWTLAEVSTRSGVSIPTISRAERGQLALSYEKFSALARALNIDMGALFAQEDGAPLALDKPVVTRAGRGVRYRGQSMVYEFLGTQASAKQMSPILATIHARAVQGLDDFARHDGEEFVYVLSGTVDVHFDTGEVVKLAKGDSLYFDSRIGHAYVSTSRQLARTIGATTSESSLMRHARQGAARGKRSKPPVR